MSEKPRRRHMPGAVRCDHDGLKMAEVQEGHLVLRAKHHGQTHVKVVALSKLLREFEDG